MERLPPVAPADEIDLYVRTYTSLLRSTGAVRVRAFEEAHAYSASSLHAGALSPEIDVAAFAYAAARLPAEMIGVTRLYLGQSHELFEAAGLTVRDWAPVRARGRRRPTRFDGRDALAVFIASASDIDDLVPIVTAYQIEWNKIHRRLASHELSGSEDVAAALQLDPDQVATLVAALGRDRFMAALAAMRARECDLSIVMLSASYSQYQRAAQRWWSGVEPKYLRAERPRRPPVYFVSSNTHAIANLWGGYALSNQAAIVEYAERVNPEGLRDELRAALASGNASRVSGFLYYLLRGFIHDDATGARVAQVRAFEAAIGLEHVTEPGHVDVDAQLIELSKLDPARIDPRLRVPGVERLVGSDARIINIDYPLGMSAYHLLSRLGQGVGELRGVYIMGKAATLNGRVGDVSLSSVVFDEHTRNTFLFDNAIKARDVSKYLEHGSVFDNQSALTVRSAFLQNTRYMGAFYRDGYTVLEMEAGPFLSAAYELVSPTRVRSNEIVSLAGRTPFEFGLLHYASDTPYSRRKELLSKSLSYFGVDSTYACAIAIVRRILELEVARLR